jgi:hypothetical protein
MAFRMLDYRQAAYITDGVLLAHFHCFIITRVLKSIGSSFSFSAECGPLLEKTSRDGADVTMFMTFYEQNILYFLVYIMHHGSEKE